MGQSRSLDGHQEDGPFHAATQCPVKATLLPYLPLAVVLTVAVRDALANRPIDQGVRLVGMVIFASNVRRQLLALLEDSRLTRAREDRRGRTEALRRTSGQLQLQACSDPLTGLPNQARLFDLTEAALAAVMTLARSLELEVVTEDIELSAQAERLRELGCRLAQGFLDSAAVPAHVLSAFLENPRDSFSGDLRFAFSVASEHSC